MIVKRPWGKFEYLFKSPRCEIKKLTIYPRHRTSLQSHSRISEIWSLISGKCKIILNEEEIEMSKGIYIDIPRLCTHRIINIGSTSVIIIEMRTGSYIDEMDICRLEDDYGRSSRAG